MNKDEALKKLQAEEFEMLLVFSEFCSQHDIAWFLESGSALGACRHSGFIPWDDDIDVGLMRADYEKLCKLLVDNPPEGYCIELPCHTAHYAPMFAKFCKQGTLFQNEETIDAGFDQGIFIDIFPYDYLSDDLEKAKRQRRTANLWQKISYIYHSTKINVPHKGVLGLIECAGCFFLHYVFKVLLSPESIYRGYKAALLCDDENLSTKCMNLVSVFGTTYNVSDILPTATHEFESVAFPVPAKLDRYLELTYGDWQKIPAPENRHTHLPTLLKFSDGSIWSNES